MTRYESTSDADLQGELVSLESLCRARAEPLEHVRTLILAQRLPQPHATRSDGVELVPRTYFHLLEAAGSVGNLEPYFRQVYAPAVAAVKGSAPDGPSIEDAWRTYLAGHLEIDAALLEAVPTPEPEEDSWDWHLRRELRRFREGERRLAGADGPEAARRRDQQLMRIGSAAWGAALALLMLRRDREAQQWFERSALSYRRSLADAEPGSWGRSIGSLKARLIAGDLVGASREAQWTVELGSADGTASPTAHYAACLASLILGEDGLASSLAARLAQVPDFPVATAEACTALATFDGFTYGHSVQAVLRTFEERPRFLEDIPVADTVLALQVLAEQRGLSVPLESPRLPEL